MNKRTAHPSRWRLRGQRFLNVALLPSVAVFAVTLGWWVSRPSTARSAHASGPNYPRARGPIPSAICGTNAVPRPPPPIDSPYGRHLYANTSLGAVHPLPAMAIADSLMPPETVGRAASSTAATSSPGAGPAQRGIGALGGPSAAAQSGGATAANADPAHATDGRGSRSTASPTRNETAQDDVASVSQLLEEYRRVFGAMPVGELNDEIVRRLQGDNPLGIAVLPKDHPAISANGELLDRWGTPYRFHPESAWVMTVRSAGPDRRMWTSDDILSTEGNQPTAQGLLTGGGQ